VTQVDIPASAAGGVLLAGAAMARINQNRIIVDCPAPYCRSALMVPPFHPGYECWDCGWSAPIVWPPNLADIVAVLLLRPDPTTRCWLPGETVMDLVAQNIEHGIVPAVDALELAQSSGPLLREMDGRVVAGSPLLVGDVGAARDRLDQLAAVPPARVDRLALED
jgi:hypothetical protein